MHNFLKFSEAASLGFHGMALLAWRRERVAVKEMVAVLGVSEAHMAKVFQRLVKGGLVRSHRGPRGGFDLARDPGAISLMEIYETLEGAVPSGKCLLQQQNCPFKECFLGKIIKDMEAQVSRFLKETTLEVLAKKKESAHECQKSA